MQVITTGMLVQVIESVESFLAHLNRNGCCYELRNNVEIWHKGHNSLYGVIQA